ncbi:hypothetical protein ERO13_D02G143801v2 [Gossypium hirsutum]|nr:hypothetical protein ERO13_D02G143801v2 [Gossypium hirsutum]
MGSEYFAQIVPNNYYCKGQHVSRIEGSIKIHFQHSAFWRPPTFNPNKAIRAQMLLSFTRGLVLQCYSHRIHGLQSLLFLRKSGIRFPNGIASIF